VVVNHEQHACLVGFFFFEPFSFGDEQSNCVLDGFAAAFVAHVLGDLVEFFEEFGWECYAYSDDFCHGSHMEYCWVFDLKAFICMVTLNH